MLSTVLYIKMEPAPSRHFSHRICFEGLASFLNGEGFSIRSVATGRAAEPAVRARFRDNQPDSGSKRVVHVTVEADELSIPQKGFTHKLILRGLRKSLQ